MIVKRIQLLRKICNPHGRIARFIAVGVLNTFVGYGIYAICLWFGLHYTASIAVSVILGTLFNFRSTGTLVFQSTANHRIYRFLAVYVVLYTLNVSGVALLLSLGLDAYEAGLVMLPPLALISYQLQSRLVFTDAERD